MYPILPQIYTLFHEGYKILNDFLQDAFKDLRDYGLDKSADGDFQFNISNDVPQLCNEFEHSHLIRELGSVLLKLQAPDGKKTLINF